METRAQGSLWRALHWEIAPSEVTPLESPLDCKEIQAVHPKRNQSWIFIGRTDVEAEAPILWPPDAKNSLIGKDPDAGNIEDGRKKGTTEDEMVGWPSPTQWMWVWVSSGSWWWTGRPGMLQSMGSQRVRHDWATELTDWSDPCVLWLCHLSPECDCCTGHKASSLSPFLGGSHSTNCLPCCCWLHWVFVAVCRLSLVVVTRDCSSLSCVGFSFCRAQTLGTQA